MFGGYEIALWALLLIATGTDLRWNKIHNALTIPFFFSGFLYQFCLNGFDGFSNASAAVAVATILYFPLYRLGVQRAGDVKLLMAFAAWSEPWFVFKLALCSILFGAVVGLIEMLRAEGVRGSFASVAEHLKPGTIPAKSHRIPFAPAFLCAFMVLKVAEMYRWPGL